MSGLTLNLEKLEQGKQNLVLSLKKKGVTAPPSADLAFDLDVSGSFHDEHRDGLTQTLLERLVPWGMLFDPDQKLDVFTFSNGAGHAHHVGDITPATVDGYIQRSIINRVPGYNGGTDYSYVLEKNLQHFGWLAGTSAPAEKRSRFGSFFGGNKAAPTAVTPTEKKRSIVLFVTDGDNSDKARTEQVLADSETRKDEVYFLFIGISNESNAFPFLKKIGDRFNNTGLAVIPDLRRFNSFSDEQVNDLLIGDELIEWLKK